MSTNNDKSLGFFPQKADSKIAAATPYMVARYAEWLEVDTLYGGTETMRLAGERYLPRQPKETEFNYGRRLHRSTLHNFYKSSIQSAVGKVFAKDMIVDGGSPLIEMLIEDVDAQGQNLTQFSRQLLTHAINHGIAYILVDHTRVSQEYMTLADKLNSGARPYWVSIAATKVLDARSANFGGTTRLSYFRFLEEATCDSEDGLNQLSFRQVRIFKQEPGGPVMFAVYREQTKHQWDLIDSGVLAAVDAIPVVPVATNHTSFFQGRPPLKDLADVNIQHWQCSSDYQNSVHVATIPFLLTKGLQQQMDKDGNLIELKVDVASGITATSPEASVEWIEVTGAALEAARLNLSDLVMQMERLGTTLCAQQSGNTTATEKAVNASETNSVIKAWALQLQDRINGALMFTAQYLGIDLAQAGSAQVNVDYSIDYADSTTFGNVLAMFTTNLIDGDTVVAEAKRRDILDVAADITALTKIAPPPTPAPGTDDKNKS